MQAGGGAVLEIGSGDTVDTDPGKWHWHGAAPDSLMTHLTIYEAPEEGFKTEWVRRSPTTSTTAVRSRADALEPQMRNGIASAAPTVD